MRLKPIKVINHPEFSVMKKLASTPVDAKQAAIRPLFVIVTNHGVSKDSAKKLLGIEE